MFFVYKITNTVNNKVYIGKTNNIQKRWKRHISAADTKNSHDYSYIHRAINKYGAQNFSVEEIASYEIEEDALKGEIFFIEKYGSTNRTLGYNLTLGGDGASGHKLSDEAKAKISKANTGKKRSPECKKKMSESRLGSKRNETTKQKMREARAKQILSPEHMYNFSHAHLGKKLPTETKNKISSNNASRKLTDQDILSIIDLINQQKLSTQLIAEQFNIDASIISKIRSGAKWNQYHHLIKMSEERYHCDTRKKRVKLTEPQAIQIIKLINNSKTDDELSKQFNVNPRTIYDIRKGKSWEHLNHLLIT